jgi:outer membrane protein assembly factor BamB
MERSHPRRFVFPAVTLISAMSCAVLAVAVSPPAAAAARGPSIKSVQPARVRAGKVITIRGTDLRSVSKVSIHGVAASFRVRSATELTAIVPKAATSGHVTVKAGATSAASQKPLTVTATVTGFTPPDGQIGTKVIVYGTGLTAPCTVSFGSVQAICNLSSATKIVTSIPPGAVTGPVTVTSGGGTFSSPSPLDITSPQIVLSPASGPPGSAVTVTGTGFAASDAVNLYAGTTDQALVITSSAGSFSYPGFTIPSAAQPGSFWVSAVGSGSGDAAQTAFDVQSSWPEFDYDLANDLSNPYENSISTANVSSLGLDWSFTGGGGSFGGSPAVAGGVLYVGGGNGDLYALNPATGAVQWSFAAGSGIQSSPAVSNGVVYFGDNAGTVYAVSASTGTELWSYSTGGQVYSSPAVSGGLVYVGSVNDTLYALNAATGALAWSYTTGNWIYSSPSVANGVVYIGSYDFSLYALNAQTGAVLWSYDTGRNGYIDSAPAIADGVVYVGTQNGDLFALNAATGTELWSYSVLAAIESSPTVAGGLVYFGTNDGGTVYALSTATGQEVWSYQTGQSVNAGSTVANGILYVPSENDTLYALDAATGTRLWSYTTGSNLVAPPVVVNGTVYLSGYGGGLDAFGLPGAASQAAARTRDRPAVRSLRPDRALKARS